MKCKFCYKECVNDIRDRYGKYVGTSFIPRKKGVCAFCRLFLRDTIDKIKKGEI